MGYLLRRDFELHFARRYQILKFSQLRDLVYQEDPIEAVISSVKYTNKDSGYEGHIYRTKSTSIFMICSKIIEITE